MPPAALVGATITLSNFGMLGGRYASLVVVPPQVAILGAGRIADEPVAVDGTVAVARTLPLSLTFDHRGGQRRRGGALPRRRAGVAGSARLTSTAKGPPRCTTRSNMPTTSGPA
ncbi:MAG: 2-oxo acid dehydrogenase subunit E2 [Alphaproteobacteria bacterium]